MIRARWRLAVIALAVAGAAAPIPAESVERFYSNASYLLLQGALTGLSNFTAFPLFDALWIGVVLSWLVITAADVARRRTGGWMRVAGRLIGRTLVAAAVIYIAFLATWGLNYRRVPLTEKLAYDPALMSPDSVRGLALAAVGELNALHRSARQAPVPARAEVAVALARGFGHAQEALGVPYPVRPARPKQTLLDPYFRAAGVEGMTAPFFLETLVPADLLAVERPAVIAHEWSHLAGFADEGEASFVGWLACLHGSAADRYSGWLFLYGEAAAALSAADREHVALGLSSGPREDLLAIADRRRRNIRPFIASEGWRMYDRYLKVNRIAAGVASYGQVLRLVIGTELGRATTAGRSG